MRRDEGGQALIEFALVLPIVLLLLFGLLQFALVLNARQTVAYAAQAAASGYAQSLVRRDADAAAAAAATQLRPAFAAASTIEYRLIRGSAESVITADTTGGFGDLVAARVTYRYPSPVRASVAGFRFPDTLSVTAEALARIEAPGTASSAPGPGPTPVPTPSRTPVPTPTPAPTASATPTASPTAEVRSVRICTFGGTAGSVYVFLYGLNDRQPTFTIDGGRVERTDFVAARLSGRSEDYWQGVSYSTRNGWHQIAAQVPGFVPAISIYDRADGRNTRCLSGTMSAR